MLFILGNLSRFLKKNPGDNDWITLKWIGHSLPFGKAISVPQQPFQFLFKQMVPFNWWSYLGITGSEQRVLNKTKNASHLRFLHLAAASLFRCRRIKRRFSSSPVSALRVGCRRPLQEQFQGHNLAKKMMIFERGRKGRSDGFWTELSWNMIAGHRYRCMSAKQMGGYSDGWALYGKGYLVCCCQK